jgi:hypothetical protein
MTDWEFVYGNTFGGVLLSFFLFYLSFFSIHEKTFCTPCADCGKKDGQSLQAGLELSWKGRPAT